MKTRLFTQVLYNNPNLNMNDIDYGLDLNPYDLLIQFRDGRVIIFDTFDNTYRYIPYANRPLTDEEEILEFSIRLKQQMRRSYIDQDELSRRTGISRNTINKYLNKKSIPNYVSLCRIADAVNCTLNDLRYRKINLDDERWDRCISY